MTAAYTIRWRESAASAEWTSHLFHPDTLAAAREDAASSARRVHEVIITDGYMTLARWLNGTEICFSPEVGGHEDGCTCWQCENRAAHLSGSHHDRVCAHARCRACSDCGDCEATDADERWFAARVRTAGSLNTRATDTLTIVNEMIVLLRTEASDLCGIDGEIGSQAAVDAKGKLERAAMLLRDVGRIAALWQDELRDLAESETR